MCSSVKIKKLLSICLVMLLVACMPLSALAADGVGSFTYSYPVDGVNFRLYQVGKIVNDEFLLNDEYAEYAVDLLDENAGAALGAYVLRDGHQPIAEAETVNGKVAFEGLELGIYLLIGDTAVKDGVRYTPAEVLFSVPQTDEDGSLVWDITAQGKYSTIQLTEVWASKIWNDEGQEDSRPDSITVQLLCDGLVYDEQKLSADNNWACEWKNLDPSHTWTVAEKETPDGYQVSLEKDGERMVLINTPVIPPSPPDTPPDIPQTGQLWWPVGILSSAGLILILTGLIIRKKYRT